MHTWSNIKCFPNQTHFKEMRVLDPMSSISSSLSISLPHLFPIYLSLYLYDFFTHFFTINSEPLIQRQVHFSNLFSINLNAKMGCTYFYTIFKYLDCRSYLASGSMLDTLLKTLNNKTSSITCSEREKRMVRMSLSSQLPSILIVDHTSPRVRYLSPSKWKWLNTLNHFTNETILDEKEWLGCNFPFNC